MHDSSAADSVPGGDPLGLELARAQSELYELEQAIQVLPEVLESKFRLRILALEKANRRLAFEHQQLNGALQGAPQLPLPAHTQSSYRWLQPLEFHGRKVALVAATVTALSLLGWAAVVQGPGLWRSASTVRPIVARPVARPVARSLDSVITLRAIGSSWLEVQDLQSREILLTGVLERGDERMVRMRQGLRMRSGRPDLLMVQIDDGPMQHLGQNENLGWRTLIPPEMPSR